MRDASYGHHRSPERHLDMVCGLWCWFTIGMQNSNSGKATSLISEAVPLRARLVAGVINLSHNSAVFIWVGSHKPRCILDTPSKSTRILHGDYQLYIAPCGAKLYITTPRCSMLHHAIIYIYLHDWVTFDVKVWKIIYTWSIFGNETILDPNAFFPVSIWTGLDPQAYRWVSFRRLEFPFWWICVSLIMANLRNNGWRLHN